MQALLEGDQTTFEGNEKVKKLIFWMLSLVQERSSAKYERIQKLVRSRLQKEDIEVEQNEDEREFSKILLSFTTFVEL